MACLCKIPTQKCFYVDILMMLLLWKWLHRNWKSYLQVIFKCCVGLTVASTSSSHGTQRVWTYEWHVCKLGVPSWLSAKQSMIPNENVLQAPFRKLKGNCPIVFNSQSVTLASLNIILPLRYHFFENLPDIAYKRLHALYFDRQIHTFRYSVMPYKIPRSQYLHRMWSWYHGQCCLNK